MFYVSVSQGRDNRGTVCFKFPSKNKCNVISFQVSKLPPPRIVRKIKSPPDQNQHFSNYATQLSNYSDFPWVSHWLLSLVTPPAHPNNMPVHI